MFRMTFKTEGFQELDEQLQKLSKDFRSDLVVKNTLVKALKNSALPVYETAFSLARYDANRKSNYDADGNNKPHMRDTLKVDARIPNARDQLSEYVNPTDAAIAVISFKKSAVSLANEFGTAKMSAKPALRPALESNIGNVTDKLKSELAAFMDAYSKRMYKKVKK